MDEADDRDELAEFLLGIADAIYITLGAEEGPREVPDTTRELVGPSRVPRCPRWLRSSSQARPP